MAHRVQINQDQTVLDDIPYSDGDIAELDDDAFNAIPPGMFTSGKLTDLGAVGGGAAISNNGSLSLQYQQAAVASVVESETVGDSIPMANGYSYAADGNTDTGHFDTSGELVAAGGDGLLLGEYRVNHSGSDSIWFTKPGLYVVQCNLSVGGGSTGRCGVRIDCGGVSPVSIAHRVDGDVIAGVTFSLTFVVVPAAVVATTGVLSTGDSLQLGAWQSSGSAQDLNINFSIARVL